MKKLIRDGSDVHALNSLGSIPLNNALWLFVTYCDSSPFRALHFAHESREMFRIEETLSEYVIPGSQSGSGTDLDGSTDSKRRFGPCFSDTEMFWGCKINDANESFPEATPHFSQSHVFHLEKRLLSHSWSTIVTLYTSGKLTFNQDNLVGISGIARAVQEETNDEYSAGLWRKDIGVQLGIIFGQRLPRRRVLSIVQGRNHL